MLYKTLCECIFTKNFGTESLYETITLIIDEIRDIFYLKKNNH